MTVSAYGPIIATHKSFSTTTHFAKYYHWDVCINLARIYCRISGFIVEPFLKVKAEEKEPTIATVLQNK